jgi:hypothetical protein
MMGSSSEVSAATATVDLVLVEVGDLLQHGVHGAGLLADADHLHDHRREDAGLGERAGHVLALADLLPRVVDGAHDDLVAGGLGDDVERVEDGHAGESSVPSVPVKRATTTLRRMGPMSGELSG